jgi:hypothetical protein
MSIDLSSEAIDSRLRRVAQLRKLCVSLRSSRPTDAPDKKAPAHPETQDLLTTVSPTP